MSNRDDQNNLTVLVKSMDTHTSHETRLGAFLADNPDLAIDAHDIAQAMQAGGYWQWHGGAGGVFRLFPLPGAEPAKAEPDALANAAAIGLHYGTIQSRLTIEAIDEIEAAAKALARVEATRPYYWEDAREDWDSTCYAAAEIIAEGSSGPAGAATWDWEQHFRNYTAGRLT